MLPKYTKTFQLALAKGIMGIIEGLADDSSSKRIARSLNGLYPGTKEHLQTEEFSLWVGGHTFSYLLFFTHAPFLYLWMQVGWIALLCLGRQPSFPNRYYHLQGVSMWLSPNSQPSGQIIWSPQYKAGNVHVWLNKQSGGHGGKFLGKSAFWGEKKHISAELLVSHYTCLYIKGFTTSIEKNKSVQLCLTQLL